MLSSATYKANYWRGEDLENPVFEAKPVRMCDTAPLIREYRELGTMWESGTGDSEAIERRMMSIERELKKRGRDV